MRDPKEQGGRMPKDVAAKGCFMNRRQLIVLSLALAASGAQASVTALIPDARRVGSGRCSVLMLPIFDATLYASGGVWRANKPFALELAYLRPIKARQIIERSLHEMRHQGHADEGRLSRWEALMGPLFPDVDHGVRLLGVRDVSGYLRLYRADTLLGEVRDTEFTTAFFDIWLGEKTSQPKLRKQLLGLKT